MLTRISTKMSRSMLLLLAAAVSPPASAQLASPGEIAAATPYIEATAQNAGVYAQAPVNEFNLIYPIACDQSSSTYVGFNAVNNQRSLAGPGDPVLAPNNDTLYSQVVFDLSVEPMVLSVPKPANLGRRYYTHMLSDSWTNNIAYVGTTADGPRFGDFLIVGPNWRTDKAAKNLPQIRLPSNVALDFVRTEVYDTADLPIAHAIQNQISVTPLSEWKKGHRGSGNSKKQGFTTPSTALQQAYCAPLPPAGPLQGASIFNRIQTVVSPPSYEGGLTATYGQIGLGQGQPEDLEALPTEVQNAIAVGFASAKSTLADLSTVVGVAIDGWSYVLGVGEYGDLQDGIPYEYLFRGVVATAGLLGNSEDEAIYATGFVDGNGSPLNGSGTGYVMEFAPGELPPVNFFWSLTLYTLPTLELYPNPQNRYKLGTDSEPALVPNADGSLTLFIGGDPPADPALEPNWLPAPQGRFAMFMRLYGPTEAVQTLQWTTPPALPR